MAERGFHYASPVDANEDPAWSGEQPTAAEIATATADVACKQRTNLVGVWFGVEVEVENRMIEDKAAELALAKQDLEATFVRVARVTEGGRAS